MWPSAVTHQVQQLTSDLFQSDLVFIPLFGGRLDEGTQNIEDLIHWLGELSVSSLVRKVECQHPCHLLAQIFQTDRSVLQWYLASINELFVKELLSIFEQWLDITFKDKLDLLVIVDLCMQDLVLQKSKLTVNRTLTPPKFLLESPEILFPSSQYHCQWFAWSDGEVLSVWLQSYWPDRSLAGAIVLRSLSSIPVEWRN